MTATYDIGSAPKLTYTLTVDSVPTNATVVCTVTDPAGTITTPVVANPSTGTYTTTIPVALAGMWVYRFTATGAATDAEDGTFYVEANAAADLYATVAEIQARFGIPVGTDSADIERALRSASRSIDKTCGRRFHKDITATPRLYFPDTLWCARVDDFHTTTGLVVATDEGNDGTYETVWSASDYQLEPLNGVVDGEGGWPFSKIAAIGTRTFPPRLSNARRAPIQITAQWGWTAIPSGVREACLIVAAELARLKDAPFGVVAYGDFGPIRIRDNPVVMRHLGPYDRYAVKVA